MKNLGALVVCVCSLTTLAFLGCGDKLDPAPAGGDIDTSNGSTYCYPVKQILENYCTRCHASALTGGSRNNAPTNVNFDTYEAAAASAERANGRIQDGTMPPGGGVSQEEKDAFQQWVDEGLPEDCPAGVDGDGDAVALTCVSGRYYTGEESATMRPGENCIACHAREGEGPVFELAGTVMGAFHDEDRCVGVSGVTVEITGDDGNKTTLVSNSSGNFFYPPDDDRRLAAIAAIKTPYTVALKMGGKERRMSTAQTNRNCMDCHTALGTNDAPGRIVAPE
ncbi:MAG: hypothetical protein C4523_01180 [Myxococcales bacterium]|nr:MAG: hypothetical protein C4523_01180 [Myxococcales bacterium]